MFTTNLTRRLPSLLSAAPPAQPIPPWSNLRSQIRVASHNSSTQSLLPRRQFSQTSATLSSPFRLSSNNTTKSSPSSSSNAPKHLYDYLAYKPKRQWPPDMSKLSPKHQFRLERKYRRRAALKFARPKWTKATKLVQWGVIGFVLVYAVLFMEWDEKGSPVGEVRDLVFGSVKGAFSAPPPPGSLRKAADDASKEQ